MKRYTHASLILLVAVLLVSACTSLPETPAIESTVEEDASQDSEVQDQVSLMNALRAGGANVELSDSVEQVFFAVTGQILKVSDKDV